MFINQNMTMKKEVIKIITKKCEVCGKEFKIKQTGRPPKYCSEKCKRKKEHERIKEKRKIIKKCKWCGKTFEGNKKQKYCSKECSNKAKLHQTNERNKWRYANDEEYRKRHDEYDKEKRKIIKICPICGREFEGNGRLKYCSLECREKGNRKKQLERVIKREKRKINELNKLYKGDLNKILENIPTAFQEREAITLTLFGESYSEAMFKKINQTPKCELTGVTDDLVIHHLYSFNNRPELATDQANMIRISKQLHQIFHKKYGWGNNTPEQFEEFIDSITCKYCGKIFIPNMKGGKQIYCSSECYEKARRDITSKRNSYKWYNDIEFRKRQVLKYGGGLGTITLSENKDNDWEKELIRVRALKKQAGLNKRV